jgi:hypothetical protein
MSKAGGRTGTRSKNGQVRGTGPSYRRDDCGRAFGWTKGGTLAQDARGQPKRSGTANAFSGT